MNSKYKIIFAGTPEFSASILRVLLTRYEIAAVYTQPDRPAGRGQKVTASPVKTLALQHGLSIYQPASLKNEEEQKTLASLGADLMIVVAYGLILPKPILTAPRLGCINVHASLLPRWRGAAPIQRAILAGDEETGITIMQMAEGLDTGPMLYKKNCNIDATDTAQTLHDRLAEIGADALLFTLDHLSELTAIAQDDSEATYAHKIKKEEAKLNWNLSAIELDRMIRAFNPWPVTFFNDIRVWEAQITDFSSIFKPGLILNVAATGIDVATGKGVIRLLKLQLPGGKVLPVKDILNSNRFNLVKDIQL